MFFVKYDSYSLPKEDLSGETSMDIPTPIFLGGSLAHFNPILIVAILRKYLLKDIYIYKVTYCRKEVLEK